MQRNPYTDICFTNLLDTADVLCEFNIQRPHKTLVETAISYVFTLVHICVRAYFILKGTGPALHKMSNI